MLGVAAVVTSGGASRQARRRERTIGALLAIGSPAARRGYHPLLALPPLLSRSDASADGLLAQVEEALAEELERAQTQGAPATGLQSLHGRLLEVRAAREHLRLAEVVERYQSHGPPAAAAEPGATSGPVADATMRRALLRHLAQRLRSVPPGLLGLLVNVVA